MCVNSVKGYHFSNIKITFKKRLNFLHQLAILYENHEKIYKLTIRLYSKHETNFL